MSLRRELRIIVAACVGMVLYFALARNASAIPSFARKYQTSCQTCHTIYPVLNPFGEAFRRDGYRFPSQNGSVDSDATKGATVAMGQEEYEKTFPDSVWPDKIMDAIPLSAWVNGSVAANMPNTAAAEGTTNSAGTPSSAGHTFTWSGIVAEMHLFAGGAFNDTLTYFTQLTLESDFGNPAGTFDIETAYLLWNDIVGPRHLFNLWVGRLFAPQLTSFGLHSDYLNDTALPGVSVAGLYNPTSSFTLGMGHTDGVELNGIAGHRFGYALGWVASSAAAGLGSPNAADVYAHIGIKSGGVALDGEGKYGPNVPDPRKPWAEKSITLDLFGYHGLQRLDNGTGATAGGTPSPQQQDDQFNAAGVVLHGQLDSLVMMAGAQVERHDRPFQGTASTTTPAGTIFNGVPDLANATSYLQYDEIDYVVWPWFVPGVRFEYTHTPVPGGADAELMRIIPGVAMLARPNIKVVVSGDLERGTNLPVTGSWAAAGGIVNSPAGEAAVFEAEQINVAVGVGF
jgi:hypothetical protein